MENLHPTEIRVLEVVRDGKDWRSMNPARKALLERFPNINTVTDYPEAFKDRDDVVGQVLRKVWRSNTEHWWMTKKPTFYTERPKVQTLFAKDAERRAREREERRKEIEVENKIADCWGDLKAQGFSVPAYPSFKVLYKLSIIEGKVRPEFYDCDRNEMVWFNEE